MNNNFEKNPKDMTQRRHDMIGNITSIAPSELSSSFFTDENLNYLNGRIIERVKKITLKKFKKGLIIEPQRRHLMIILMRYIYLENHSKHIVLENKTTLKRIAVLNNMFLKLVVPSVVQELISYVKYIRDFNAVPVLLDNPETNESKRGIINEYIRF